MSAQSSLVLHCRIRPVARMARDTNSELRAARLAALALRAHNCARAHACAERSTANPELQPARTPHALQEAELFLLASFGEAYSALRGWRPIPAALPSHSIVLV